MLPLPVLVMQCQTCFLCAKVQPTSLQTSCIFPVVETSWLTATSVCSPAARIGELFLSWWPFFCPPGVLEGEDWSEGLHTSSTHSFQETQNAQKLCIYKAITLPGREFMFQVKKQEVLEFLKKEQKLPADQDKVAVCKYTHQSSTYSDIFIKIHKCMQGYWNLNIILVFLLTEAQDI